MSEFKGKCELRYEECTEITWQCVIMNIVKFKINIEMDKCEYIYIYIYTYTAILKISLYTKSVFFGTSYRFYPIDFDINIQHTQNWGRGGTRWRSWWRHCAKSRKDAGSIPDGVIAIFH